MVKETAILAPLGHLIPSYSIMLAPPVRNSRQVSPRRPFHSGICACCFAIILFFPPQKALQTNHNRYLTAQSNYIRQRSQYRHNDGSLSGRDRKSVVRERREITEVD